MPNTAALASSLMVGFVCFAAGAAGRATGTKPIATPASNPPKMAICRNFTGTSPSSKFAAQHYPRNGIATIHFW
jgi:hypothetical protein